MKGLFKKRGAIFSSFLGFYLLAVLMLWLKTYFTQTSQFDLGVEGTLQQFLLLINPLGSALLFLAISFLFKGTRKYSVLILIYIVMTALLYANAVHYRFFSDFITLPSVMQTQNFGDLGGSVLSLLQPSDLLFFVDVALLLYLRYSKKVQKQLTRVGWKTSLAIVAVAITFLAVNLQLAEKDRPQLLSRGFDRTYIVKYLGMYNYAIYDTVKTVEASTERAKADSDDIVEVINYTKGHYAPPNEKYFGISKDMNVVYIHLESVQNFLIDYQLNGVEVMPFLNSLTKDPNFMYFDHFYHQTAQGKTADAEFMLENSLYGLPQGSAFVTKGQNTYEAAPNILKDYGYTSAVFHGNNGTFWNRNVIYNEFGYDEFFDIESYDTSDPKNMAEYGLMDKPFFEQSKALLETLPQPFYTKFITVAHHFPYKIDQELTTIEKATTNSSSVNNYFQTARYADEALAQFFAYLKESGLYNNTMIVMYGDHYGISDNHYEAMEQILGQEVTPVVHADLQKVPLLIYVPGMEGGINHSYGGQIDLLPTVLHLLGVETQNHIHFGTDLLSTEHQQVVPFRNSDFVSPTIYSVDGKYYNRITGEEIDETQPALLEEAKSLQGIIEQRLEYSDKVVNGDLLRFHSTELE